MSSRRLDIHLEAMQEAITTTSWYARHSHLAAHRFLHELRRVQTDIVEHLERAAEIEPGIRRTRLRRFPYGVIYRVLDDCVQIIPIAHLRRQPNYWRHRRR